jgi:murein DD-endopeptidase MepM/ murein hydrolase activator NlpD
MTPDMEKRLQSGLWTALAVVGTSLTGWPCHAAPEDTTYIAMEKRGQILPIGLVGDLIEAAGKATGSKEIEEFGQNLDEENRRVKEKVDLYKSIDELPREVVTWIEKNPEEALALGVVVAVGWAACVDGCTLIGSIIAGGAAIPIAGVELNRSNKPDLPQGNIQKKPSLEEPQAGKSEPQQEVQVYNSSGDMTITYSPRFQKEYPPGYSKVDYPNGVPPVVRYKYLHENLGNILNEFSFPTRNGLIRYPADADPAGGIFESPRSGLPAEEAKYYEPEARRVHGGIDFLTFPGDPILAPMTGTIEAIRKMTGKNGLQMINIRSRDGTLARVLYAQPLQFPGIREGMKVEAGNTLIGTAQNIGAAYNLDTTPNHIHVDYSDWQGRRFDPWTNKVVEKRLRLSRNPYEK